MHTGHKQDGRVTMSMEKKRFHKIASCRLCGNENLVPVVDLGDQYLTGVFPRDPDGSSLTCGPLRLVKCHGDESVCGLLQLEHSYDHGEMYGENYGYRSGLNESMVRHLQEKVKNIIEKVPLEENDLVIDIGSNDGTTLAAYPEHLELVGIDPTGNKFKKYYRDHITLLPEFFSASLVKEMFPGRKAKVITSFSMIYDLEDPMGFTKQIASILDPEDGLWVFEQSYMPLMLERIAFDTICHEHLEYYGLRQIIWMLERAGMEVVDVSLNDTNGGSFQVMATIKGSRYATNSVSITDLLDRENSASLYDLKPYEEFRNSIERICEELKNFVHGAREEGSTICGLGASTKGNVLLQYCGFTDSDIEAIGEVNTDKYGAYTPGTWIPIISQEEVIARRPDYLIVMPWHFRDFFLNNIYFQGQKLVFPLPELDVVEL